MVVGQNTHQANHSIKAIMKDHTTAPQYIPSFGILVAL